MATKSLKGTGDVLFGAIVRVLSERPGLESKRIATILRAEGWSVLRRKEVNLALYRGLSSHQFKKNGSTVPKWWLGRPTRPNPTIDRPPPSDVTTEPARPESRRRQSEDSGEFGPGPAGGDWRVVELE